MHLYLPIWFLNMTQPRSQHAAQSSGRPSATIVPAAPSSDGIHPRRLNYLADNDLRKGDRPDGTWMSSPRLPEDLGEWSEGVRFARDGGHLLAGFRSCPRGFTRTNKATRYLPRNNRLVETASLKPTIVVAPVIEHAGVMDQCSFARANAHKHTEPRSSQRRE